jgi:hypothetical protein
LYRCPADRSEDPFLDWDHPPPAEEWEDYRWSSFVTNGLLDDKVGSKGTDNPYNRVSRIPRPHHVIFACELAEVHSDVDHLHPEYWFGPDDSKNYIEHKRHAGKSNFLCADGCVSPMKIEETYTYEKVNLWNPKNAPAWAFPWWAF